MKGRPIDQLVYEQMFPRPKSNDPQNFRSLLERNLVQEVRQEVVSFYGHLDTQEAKYPGLDYTHPIHRIRLSRWPWHRRLFRAFDALRLTPNEIYSLTKWEGTKWAKERFEREEGIVIRDTAADEFPDWVEPEDRVEETTAASTPQQEEDEDMDAAEEESDEEPLESVGVALNERLRERAARRAAGDTSTILDEEWEQWLKNAIETGELSNLTEQILSESDVFPQRMIQAARAGRWNEVPEFMRDMIRRTLESEQVREQRALTSQPAPTSSLRSTQTRSTRVWEFRPSRSNLRMVMTRSGAGSSSGGPSTQY
ncbi:hypothetical protein MKZ38_008862 [Zalerion maritima]|uniref:Uncharacterized protein n=1 Tax=Zalerion maritima TaxID=339359 RepID=A0AAD5RH12_9PEZI|nr:hypothetical protein MKZ38_008862 [Zalerion maritima]